MINIVHGDNVTAGRQFVLSQVKDPLVFEAKTLTEEILTQSLESSGLFGPARPVLINHLPSKELLTIISSHAAADIYLWHNKTLSKTALKPLGPKIKITEFKLPQSIFAFLDNPNLKSLHQAVESNPIELIFYLFSRRVSQLIQIKDNPDLVKTSPWQKQKLLSQARSWTIDQLLNWHHRLLKLDFAQKNGQDPFSLLTGFEQLWY